jgi:hypothetical protein
MIRLLAVVIALSAAACVSTPTEAHVDWKTQGRSIAFPETEYGVRISYEGQYESESTWVQGYDGLTVIDVYPAADTTQMCATLERRLEESYEQFGQEKTDWWYEPHSERVCLDVPVDDRGVLSPTFDLVYTP